MNNYIWSWPQLYIIETIYDYIKPKLLSFRFEFIILIIIHVVHARLLYETKLLK